MMDWPSDPGASMTPTERALLLMRLRRTVRELEEMGFVAPAQLATLAKNAPDAPEDNPDPFDNLPL